MKSDGTRLRVTHTAARALRLLSVALARTAVTGIPPCGRWPVAPTSSGTGGR